MTADNTPPPDNRGMQPWREHDRRGMHLRHRAHPLYGQRVTLAKTLRYVRAFRKVIDRWEKATMPSSAPLSSPPLHGFDH